MNLSRIISKLFSIPSDLQRKLLIKRLKKNKPLKNLENIPFSNIRIDIIIPAIDKDIAVLPFVIDGARENIKHQIDEIYIVSPDSECIKELCRQKNCKFINENSVLPLKKQDINYVVNGIDRSGWLFQQFIKLSADLITNKDFCLILDADTVLIRPQVFELNGKILFNFSDEYNKAYFKIYRKIMVSKPSAPLSFVSHHMLFERKKLIELKNKIKGKNNCEWYDVIINNIDRNSLSGFSEYETYGNYIISNYPEEVSLEYWYNLSLNKEQIINIDRIKKSCSNSYKSVSFHSYN